MLKPSILLLAGTLLASCAHTDPTLPICDGSARRPANPYGSILDGTAVTTPPTAALDAPPTSAPTQTPAPPEGGCA